MIYLQLLISYLKIGFFGFGGGYAMLSLVQQEVVARHGWITPQEFTDIVALSQVTPGPIAINSATYVGYAATGTVWGAALATLAVCLPALTVMVLIARFYVRFRENRWVMGAMWGMQPVIVGMIAAAALMLAGGGSLAGGWAWMIFLAVLVASLAHISPVWLLVASGAAGYIIYR